MIYYIIIAIIYLILVILLNPDGWLYLKLFDNHLECIRLGCRLYEMDYMENVAIYKLKSIKKKPSLFRVGVVNESNDRIGYLEVYSSTSVYINDEKVCIIHRLRKNFHISRSIEYAKNRPVDEIKAIIRAAYTEAKDRISINAEMRMKNSRNSFFK